jgi:hypothetical protein
MAETYRQKSRRWLRRDFTKSELVGIIAGLVADNAIDVATGGKLSAMKKSVLVKAFTLSRPVVSLGGRLAGQAALGTARVLGSSAIGAAAPFVNPYTGGLVLGGAALASPPGQELLEAAGERGRMDRIRFEQALTDVEFGIKTKVKRTKSKFNNAVSAGMKAVKNSTSYGKKGIINAPKKAFKTVVKVASAVNRMIKAGKKPKKPKSPLESKIFQSIITKFKR